ncbi:antitoxin Xre/MbcA/ParS toxin-binding domain-containing protein [Cesiribacter sp. SM1]|uniref:type II RES/Xre toxin-antitoxin system antitoxin n=1 Tax=Cesiribacter sp. SM1 TaxID=2861196 RepID=UPI001CD2C777|nr:antitoxin Xre/MbcA/ParS toxin-binding domain-containing protein [Cesiribacter sp. SM1]
MSAQAQDTEGLLVVKDNLQLIHLRDEGVDVQYFRNLQDHSSMPKAELAHFLGVDPTTVDNYRKQNKKFTGDSAEKLLKLHRLFALGEELFGSTDEFTDWLHMPSPGLEGQKPVGLLHSITGIGEIEKQLNRIIHGYVA